MQLCSLAVLQFSFAHLHICTSEYLNIGTSAHLHICTSAHLHICTSAHLHICTSAYWHIYLNNNGAISFKHTLQVSQL
jgi:hypothetical protein